MVNKFGFKAFLLSSMLAFASSLFAVVEDWTGKFEVMSPSGRKNLIEHYPNRVSLFGGAMTAGQSISLPKGSNLNGMILSDNVRLAKVMNVEQFTNEVKKFGPIVSQNITLGSTYTVE